jgi:catalase-peroxidase
MGPLARYHGAEVPDEVLIWQDPIPETITDLTEESTASLVDLLDSYIINGWLTIPQLVKTAWASASTFRNTDKRGGANGARVALKPQREWDVNEPGKLAETLDTLEELQATLNSVASGPSDISLADLIVFAGSYAVQKAAEAGGSSIRVPYVLGRGDATQELTDVESFESLRPIADGFRNWAPGNEEIAERLLIEKAALLGLTPTELTVLVGGLRVLGVTHVGSTRGVLTDTPGVLDNSYFRNLLSNDIAWAPKAEQPGVYGSHAYEDGEHKWTATRADLVFASNSVLRAIAEVYASDDAKEKFVKDFVAAWIKVMNNDRFDVK